MTKEHAIEKQAAAKQTFVFQACFNEKADLRSKSRKLRSSELSIKGKGKVGGSHDRGK